MLQCRESVDLRFPIETVSPVFADLLKEAYVYAVFPIFSGISSGQRVRPDRPRRLSTATAKGTGQIFDPKRVDRRSQGPKRGEMNDQIRDIDTLYLYVILICHQCDSHG